MPTLTLTRPGDTWHGIAQEQFGHNYSDQDLQDLLKANECSFYYWNQHYQLQNPQQHDVFCALPPYRAIWLPKNGCFITAHDEALVRMLDSAPLSTRRNLAYMEASGVSPHYALAAKHFAQQVQAQKAKEKAGELSKIQKLQLATGMAFADQIGDRLKEEIAEFLEKSAKLNSVLLRNAHSGGLFGPEVQTAYNEAVLVLNRGVLKCAKFFTGFKLDALNNMMKTARKAQLFRRYRGFSVTTMEGMQDINDIGRFSRVMFPVGMLGIDVLLGVLEVSEDYEDGKDWKKAAAGETGMVLGSLAGGQLSWKIIREGMPALLKKSVPYLKDFGVSEEGLTMLGLADTGEATIGLIGAITTAPAWVPIVVATAAAVGLGYMFKYFGEEIYEAV